MPANKTTFKNSNTGKIVLLLSVLAATFWCISGVVNVYQPAIVGVIFEILWLPMLALLFLLPVVSIIFLVRERFSFKSFYLYSLLIIGLALFIAQAAS